MIAPVITKLWTKSAEDTAGVSKAVKPLRNTSYGRKETKKSTPLTID